jgi:hypothetical protein
VKKLGLMHSHSKNVVLDNILFYMENYFFEQKNINKRFMFFAQIMSLYNRRIENDKNIFFLEGIASIYFRESNYKNFKAVLIKFYINTKVSAQILNNNLSEICIELTLNKNLEKAMAVFNMINPHNWTNKFKYYPFIVKFVNLLLKENRPDLAFRVCLKVSSPLKIEILNLISIKSNEIPPELKRDLLVEIESEFKNSENSFLNMSSNDKISTEVNIKKFNSNLIKLAESFASLGDKEKSNYLYEFVSINMEKIKHSGDRLQIYKGFCLSVINSNSFQFIPYILQTYSTVIPFSEFFKNDLKIFYVELVEILKKKNQNEIAGEIQKYFFEKFNKADYDVISLKLKNDIISVKKQTLNYLENFENKKQKIYNSTNEKLQQTLIEYCSYLCFKENNVNSDKLKIFKDIFDLTEWQNIGKK